MPKTRTISGDDFARARAEAKLSLPKNQRPTFFNWASPISRLPFAIHWLLSIALMIAVFIGSMNLFGMRAYHILPLVLAFLPGALIYFSAVRRRLRDLGRSGLWLILFPIGFLVHSYNFSIGGLSGAYGDLYPDPEGATKNILTLLMTPSMGFHFYLMFTPGRISKAKKILKMSV